MNSVSRPCHRLFLLASAFFLVQAFACQSQPDKQLFVGHGVVEAVAINGKKVRIKHEEIPGFMPAMTMDFEVKDAAVLAGISAEDAVEFTIERTPESIYLVAIARREDDQDSLVAEEATTEATSTAPTEEPAAEFVSYPASDFTLTDQDGRRLTLSSLQGKIVLLDFIFTHCPGPCPLLSLKFAQLQKQLAERFEKEVMLLSVTIDPKRDTPEVLRDYAKRYDANLAGWKFLTGSTGEIITTTAAFGADYKAGAEGIIDHRLLTCLIDRNGMVVKEFVGTNHTVEELLAAIEQLRTTTPTS